MSHIVESCPLTKLNGGLSRLHSADEDAVSWLITVMAHETHTRRRSDRGYVTLPYLVQCMGSFHFLDQSFAETKE